jgi:hypothetical protein
MSMQSEKQTPLRRFFRRGPWEAVMMALIGLGVVMLTQPFSLWLFGQSFTVILIGTIGYVIVSHFPE